MQQLNPSEISEIIKQRIDNLDVSVQAKNEGTIVSVADGIIRIHGLADVMYGEMIEFEGGLYGMALNLERDSVGAVVLGDYLNLKEGQTCRCTKRILEVPIGPDLEGRETDMRGDLLSALLNLGYHRPLAERAVGAALAAGDGTFEQILRQALKALAR